MMNHDQKQIHEKALNITRNRRGLDIDLILILQEVERTKLYRKLNCRSLFKYATELLGLSEAEAYMFNTVSKKAAQLPALQTSLEFKKVTVAKASRIVAALNEQNAEELIGYAAAHQFREIDFEIARRNPAVPVREKTKIIADDAVQITVAISREAHEMLKRVQSLLAQKQKSSNMKTAIEESLADYINRHDPVKKAERAVTRKRTKPLCHRGFQSKSVKKRVPLSAEQRHEVFARDGGRCTHTANGKRCDSDCWVQIHHIVHVSNGGSNDPSNLTTLCSFHHDLVHKMSLPIDGQVTWLRPRTVYYG